MLVVPRLHIALLSLATLGCSGRSGSRPTSEAEATPAEPERASARGDALTKAVLEVTDPPPAVAVGATLEVVATFDRQIDTRLAFGSDGQWWHWDGTEATVFHHGERREEALDAQALLALEPAVGPGQALVIGESLLTPSGVQPLLGEIAEAFEHHPMAHGGYERVATAWSPDASRLAVARRFRPSACCGSDHDHGRGPPHDLVDLYDTRSGEHHELHGPPPLAVSAERLLVSTTLYTLEPLHPLVAPTGDLPPPRALAMDPRGEVIATAVASGELRLLRAHDGAPLRTWMGPEGAAVLAFHPRLPVLAVASDERVELWRIDSAEPQRLAHAAVTGAPLGLVFDPEGGRLVATGFRPVLLRSTLEEQPAGPEPTALARALAAPLDAASAWTMKRDVDALSLDGPHVHAYARGHALVRFALDSGLPVDSWLRRHPYRGVVAAARAPIFAMLEDRYAREPEAARQRLELFDASSLATLHTLWLPLAELDPLVVSPRGTAVAWSTKDDPIATLRAADGSMRLDVHAGSTNVVAIAISEDDARMAVANRHVEHNVKVGTVGSEELVVLTTPRGVTHLLFTPDGSRLLVADYDGRVHVADPSAGTLLQTFEPGLGQLQVMAITADGEQLVVGEGGLVLVLERASGAERHRFAIAGRLRSVAISDDGTTIVAGTSEGTLHRLTIP